MEISAIQKIKNDGEIDIQWLCKEKHLADCLTKKEASGYAITSVLESGNINQ